MEWLREGGCPWGRPTCAAAARSGHLDLLILLREADCPWDMHICIAAAEGGHLNALKWAREHGCPWNEKVVHKAALHHFNDAAMWAMENGCPFDESYIQDLGTLELKQWLKNRGEMEEVTGRMHLPDKRKAHALPEGEPAHKLQAVEALVVWETLPHEIGHTILLSATNPRTSPCMWTICRFVCKQWRSLLPLPPPSSGRKFAARVAKEGNINLLKWAKKNGCPLGISTFVGAVEGSRREM